MFKPLSVLDVTFIPHADSDDTMPDICPYLEYRDESDGTQFETERAYCTVTNQFVQPMRADICNDRYGLSHDTDCEIYLDHVE